MTHGMSPNFRHSLPLGDDGDYLRCWLGMGAGRRLILSYQLPPAGDQLKPYPRWRYDGMSKLDMGSGCMEGTDMCNLVDVMEPPHSVELAALVRRYQALVDDTLAVAAAGFTPAQIAAAREAAGEALRLIRTFAATRGSAHSQAAASALSAGEANLA